MIYQVEDTDDLHRKLFKRSDKLNSAFIYLQDNYCELGMGFNLMTYERYLRSRYTVNYEKYLDNDFVETFEKLKRHGIL